MAGSNHGEGQIGAFPKPNLLAWLGNKRVGLMRLVDTTLMRGIAGALKIPVGKGSTFLGRAILRPGYGKIEIGNKVSMVSRSDTTALGVSRPVILRCLTSNARIVIGDDCGLSGTVICAARFIKIGRRCLIGADVKIFDTDFHPHGPLGRRYAVPDWNEISAPVVIGDDVFIGTGAVIQKGVTVGSGSVIAAQSVVTKDVPSMSVVGGNPAKIIRKLTHEMGT